MNSASSSRNTTPLGLRIFLWILASIVLANIAAVIAPVILEPLFAVLRFLLIQLHELELYWMRLQPLTRAALPVGVILLIWIASSWCKRKAKAGDGKEDHFC